MLELLPQAVHLCDHTLIQRPSIQPLQRLLQLLHAARPNNNRVTMLRVQHTIILHPPIRQIRLRAPRLFSDSFPLRQRLQVRRPRIHTLIDLPNLRIRIEAPRAR